MKIRTLFILLTMIAVLLSTNLMATETDWAEGTFAFDGFENDMPIIIIASSIEDGISQDWYNPEKCIDDEWSNLFCTEDKTGQSNYEWLVLELRTDRSINNFVLNWNGDNYPTQYKVFTSIDMDDWVQFGATIDHTPDQSMAMITDVFDFTTVSKRFIRIDMLNNNSSKYCLNKLKVVYKE